MLVFFKAAGCVLAEMYLKEVFVHTRGLPGIQPILKKFGTPTDWPYQWDKFGEKVIFDKIGSMRSAMIWKRMENYTMKWKI